VSDGEITETDAHAMLEFHSAIHNARTACALVFGAGAGAGAAATAVTAFSVDVLALQLAALAAMLLGVVGSVALPRAILWALRGGASA